MTRVALIPGAPVLLPAYASLTDPAAELRAACREALDWLGDQVGVVAGDGGRRVAEALLADRVRGSGTEASYLVVGNGSACRTERAPGYFDPRAEEFDRHLGEALRSADGTALASIDPLLAKELWADTEPLAELADLLGGPTPAVVDFDAAPWGVQYWVMRWHIPG